MDEPGYVKPLRKTFRAIRKGKAAQLASRVAVATSKMRAESQAMVATAVAAGSATPSGFVRTALREEMNDTISNLTRHLTKKPYSEREIQSISESAFGAAADHPLPPRRRKRKAGGTQADRGKRMKLQFSDDSYLVFPIITSAVTYPARFKIQLGYRMTIRMAFSVHKSVSNKKEGLTSFF